MESAFCVTHFIKFNTKIRGWELLSLFHLSESYLQWPSCHRHNCHNMLVLFIKRPISDNLILKPIYTHDTWFY